MWHTLRDTWQLSICGDARSSHLHINVAQCSSGVCVVRLQRQLTMQTNQMGMQNRLHSYQPHLSVFISHAGLQAGADMLVGTHVHGLLLCPQELCIGVPPQFPLDKVKGEGHQLQHTKNVRYGSTRFHGMKCSTCVFHSHSSPTAVLMRCVPGRVTCRDTE